MSQERLMMEGKLAELKRQRDKLLLKADGLINAIRLEINPALKGVEDMDIAQADLRMDELLMAQVELLSIAGDIERLKRELGV